MFSSSLFWFSLDERGMNNCVWVCESLGFRFGILGFKWVGFFSLNWKAGPTAAASVKTMLLLPMTSSLGYFHSLPHPFYLLSEFFLSSSAINFAQICYNFVCWDCRIGFLNKLEWEREFILSSNCRFARRQIVFACISVMLSLCIAVADLIDVSFKFADSNFAFSAKYC